MDIGSIISLLITLFIIYVIYLAWDYWFNGGWMRSIPGYGIFSSLTGGGNDNNQSNSWWPF